MYEKKLGKVKQLALSKVIHRIAGDKNTVSKKQLVDSARSINSPIHKYFEWNNSIAGEKYRLEQAGYYLRVIVIECEHKNVRVRMREFMPAATANGGNPRNYAPTLRLLSTDTGKKLLLTQALQEMKSFKEKYAIFKDLCDMADKIIMHIEKKI